MPSDSPAPNVDRDIFDATSNAVLAARRPLRVLIAIVIAVAIMRLVFLFVFSPYELAADEAHYWDWSRRPDLSYYTKGPGVAWTIALATLVHTSEAMIRTPAVIANALTTLAVALLAWRTQRVEGRQDARPALLAGLVFMLLPPFQITALLMTIDGPFLTCWSLAALLAWEIHRRRVGSPSRSRLMLWLALGIVLGVGFLYKYTILLLLPGLIAFYWLVPRDGLIDEADNADDGCRKKAWLGPAAMISMMLLACLPVILWNQRHGWPTVEHLLGHLHGSGSKPQSDAGFPVNPLNFLEFLGMQAGMLGPAIVLIPIALGVAWKHRNTRPRAWPGRLFLICCAAPIFLFYLAVSFISDTEGNWTLPAYVTLVALVGSVGVERFDHHRERVARWLALPKPRPSEGLLRRRPETLFQSCWNALIIFGLISGLALFFLQPLSRLPMLGKVIPIHRVSGHEQYAARIAEIARRVERETGRKPLIITDTYTQTSLLAYYLPGRPTVYCETSVIGKRVTSYDYFSDARLGRRRLQGRPAILVGQTGDRWGQALRFDRLVQVDAGVWVGYGFHGPTVESTHHRDTDGS